MDDFDRFGPAQNPQPLSQQLQTFGNPSGSGFGQLLDWSNLEQHEVAGAAIGAFIGLLIVRWASRQSQSFF